MGQGTIGRVAEYIVAHWRYDADSGIVYGTSGRQIGVKSRGYLNGSVRLDGKSHTVGLHRAAWLLTYGAWPSDQMDHRDGVRSNNRIANLREATAIGNAENRKPRRRMQRLPPGVYATREGRFTVQRRSGGKLHYAGTFERQEHAAAESLALKARLHRFNPEQRTA